MSDYTSPWGTPPNPWHEEPDETTQQMLERAERERLEAEQSEYWEGVLWRKYASRMTADGRLIR